MVVYKIKGDNCKVGFNSYLQTNNPEFLVGIASAISHNSNTRDYKVNENIKDISCIKLYLQEDNKWTYIADLDKYHVFGIENQ